MTLANAVKKIKALSDLTRLRIFLLLVNYDEICSCYFAELFGFSAPTISRHTSILCEAGLIKERKESRWVLFSLNSQDKKKKHWLQLFSNSLNEKELNSDILKMRQILDNGCTAKGCLKK
jgi:ArsR family transcriptional regulator